MWLAILIILLQNNESLADTWRVGNVTYEMKLMEGGFLLNSVAEKNPNSQAILIHKKKLVGEITEGGANPGSKVCQENQGMVFMAYQGKKTQAFCRFKDHSIISLDGVSL
ncbi:MAG: hypothetical protein K2P81_16120 [Bacteriovoracaceae bacterium]|nr:hypothetical protein [Bacteriovoracaceae bacterium]